ncbi:N-6 adenine-specific DNA methyltransferase (macronuclear) [Tetrahymena thermophila SB210]|uniref:N-6 adenine-specific DNA methyltransferase n=1 Tax=Tetrahymena thermophila (strain SB210) TaxID=312017 RepID=I7LZH4_TETTS|nr:N-6 adenine-specific DNA methyltransferase [Tetrahymena thermophila SB210]EAR83940.1 N-6 adenine-specific DNA methyltransferase [Tetrahymena thermophila SB210]|eukprot:XP_001031603.1 N-6 adenine-specific DNA methyltransferase [Tetrahymena thermophila SB210]
MDAAKKVNKFIMKNPENADFNQYWYSPKTIEILVNQVLKHGKNCAFLSTPSIFYSINDAQFLKQCYVFEFDKKFEKNNPNFVFFDFHKPEDIPAQFHNFFDFIVIDPPFITRDVWEKYANAAKIIGKKDENNKFVANVLASSIDENDKMLDELLGLKKRVARPLIPNLVYQYSLYSTYEDESLNQVNEEIGF